MHLPDNDEYAGYISNNPIPADPFSGWEKPGWDEYLMHIAIAIAMRSPDTSTKHGSLIVDKYYRPISFGYNGPPPDCDDSFIPTTRPEKYAYMEHAESNAINNATRSLEGAIVYVTGHPCEGCFRRMLCCRISKIVYGPIGSNCVTEETKEIINIMNMRKIQDLSSIHPMLGRKVEKKIELVAFKDDSSLFEMLDMQRDYLEIKLNEHRK